MTCAQRLLRLLWGGPKLECYGTVHMTVHVDQYFSTLFGMQTHFQNTQTSVAHRLRNTNLVGSFENRFLFLLLATTNLGGLFVGEVR